MRPTGVTGVRRCVASVDAGGNNGRVAAWNEKNDDTLAVEELTEFVRASRSRGIVPDAMIPKVSLSSDKKAAQAAQSARREHSCQRHVHNGGNT